MSKFSRKMFTMKVKAQNKILDFIEAENGDTNFVSMIIIIAIIIVLAGLFLTMGKTIMNFIENSIMNFLKGLGI